MSSNIKSEQSLQNLSVVFGVVFFTNSGASMFPTIQNDMKKKKYFVHVVILSFLATAAFILPISFLTYKYVEFDVLPNIISSFRQGIVQDIAYFVLGIHTLLAFSILINPVCQDFEELLGISKNFCLKRVLARSSLTVLLIFIAETVPKFDSLLNLVGGSLVSLFAFIFPALFYMRLSQLFSQQNQDSKQWKIKSWEKVLLLFIIIFGIVAAAVVTYNAVQVIVSEETFILPCYLRPFI
ncbi:Amino acid transporter AVT1D [Nymphon striatum]|nr:Amino acid transporter AVT1D [Nymphon striatum]